VKAETIFRKFDRVVTAVLKAVTTVLLVALMLIVTANILVRYFPITSLHWLDEIVEFFFAALVFYGTAAVWMAHGHFSVGDWISKRARNRQAAKVYRILVEAASLVFIAIFFFYSISLTRNTMELTSVFQIPKAFLYFSMPAASLIMIISSLARIITLCVDFSKPDTASQTEPASEG